MAGTLILNEQFTLRDGLSCSVIIIGMFLVNWNTALKVKKQQKNFFSFFSQNALKRIILGKPKSEGFKEVATSEENASQQEMDGHIIELTEIEGKTEIDNNVS
jgi:hypothetical protein